MGLSDFFQLIDDVVTLFLVELEELSLRLGASGTLGPGFPAAVFPGEETASEGTPGKDTQTLIE